MCGYCGTRTARSRGLQHTKRLIGHWELLLILLAILSIQAHVRAATAPREVVYRTPLGTLNKFGQDVSATVVVEFNHDGVKLTVTNTSAPITSPERCVTGITFSVHTDALPHLAETLGKARVVFPEGFYTASKAEETHWQLTSLGGGKYRLSAPAKSMAVINDPADGKKTYGLDGDGFARMAEQNPFLADSPTFQIRFPNAITEDQVGDWEVVWGTDPGLYGVDDLTPRTSDTGDVGGDGGGGKPNDGDGGGGGGDIGGGGGGGGDNFNPLGRVTSTALTDSQQGGGGGGSGPGTGVGLGPTGNPDGPINQDKPPISTPGSGVPEPITGGVLAVAGVALLVNRRRAKA